MTDPRQERLENLVVGAEARVLNPAYSRMVRWLRLLLPLVAVAIIVTLFTWTLLDDNQQIAEKPKDRGMEDAENELVSPKFESRDLKGNPFTVTALHAVQGKPEQGQDDKTIYLEKPTGEMTLIERNQKLSITALHGAYDQARQTLDLEGGVTLNTENGYEMRTEKVFISLKDSQANSKTALRGSGPAGTLEAAGFTADNEKGKLVLKGPARLVIKPEVL